MPSSSKTEKSLFYFCELATRGISGHRENGHCFSRKAASGKTCLPLLQTAHAIITVEHCQQSSCAQVTLQPNMAWSPTCRQFKRYVPQLQVASTMKPISPRIFVRFAWRRKKCVNGNTHSSYTFCDFCFVKVFFMFHIFVKNRYCCRQHWIMERYIWTRCILILKRCAGYFLCSNIHLYLFHSLLQLNSSVQYHILWWMDETILICGYGILHLFSTYLTEKILSHIQKF